MKSEFQARDLIWIGLALLGLLAASALTVLIPPAPWKTAAGLAIAGAKVTLIALFFMRLNRSPGLVRIFAAVGLFWLAIMATLVSADYLTR
jgi:cytochrome c oxidase subunit 4